MRLGWPYLLCAFLVIFGLLALGVGLLHVVLHGRMEPAIKLLLALGYMRVSAWGLRWVAETFRANTPTEPPSA